jgi:hypothetical protein
MVSRAGGGAALEQSINIEARARLKRDRGTESWVRSCAVCRIIDTVF